MLFTELEETGNIRIREFTGTVVALYATCVSYIQMWEGNISEAEFFS